jgi:predicted RNA-binding protein YlqC (UPF0109 family)
VKNLVEYIARALVDKPDEVALSMTPHDGGDLYELRVAQDDIGKVIGREGRTVNAIRTVLQHAALKQGQRVRLEIVDDRRGKAGAQATEAGQMPVATES